MFVVPGTTVYLDGSASYDLDATDDPYLLYSWSLVSRPGTAIAPVVQNPHFPRAYTLLTEAGTYEFRLNVSDACSQAHDTLVVVVGCNLPPTASVAPAKQRALADTSGRFRVPLVFDATYSHDPEGGSTTALWRLSQVSLLDSRGAVAKDVCDNSHACKGGGAPLPSTTTPHGLAIHTQGDYNDTTPVLVVHGPAGLLPVVGVNSTRAAAIRYTYDVTVGDGCAEATTQVTAEFACVGPLPEPRATGNAVSDGPIKLSWNSHPTSPGTRFAPAHCPDSERYDGLCAASVNLTGSVLVAGTVTTRHVTTRWFVANHTARANPVLDAPHALATRLSFPFHYSTAAPFREAGLGSQVAGEYVCIRNVAAFCL